MALVLTNNAVSKLTVAINNTATSFTVTGGTGAKFPNTSGGDTFHVSLVDSSNNIEIVKVTARATDIFTVTRGQEGTTARSFAVGDRVALTMTAEAFNSKADKATVDPLITANATTLSNHLADADDAHDASAISYTPTGTTVATNVDAALDELAAEKVQKTSDTGAAIIPVGTTAQRDGTPQTGYIRYNTTLVRYEGYYGTAWAELGGGAVGGNTDKIFYLNDKTVTTNYTVPADKNAMTAGPITIADGVTVTVSDGATWTIV